MKHLYKSGRFIQSVAIFLAFSIHGLSQPFTLQTGISFSTISDGSFAWGDYDNDNDLDLLFGSVYKNNGDNTFTKQTQIKLPVLRFGSSDWCDFNNDGFLDILITGSDSTKIYLNNKDNSFTELEETGLLGMDFCDAACADFNNDGYPDILTIGLEKTIYQSCTSILYINNKDNTFRKIEYVSMGSENPNIDCGDYNNDGNIDILCSGGNYSMIYRNNGNETFSLAFSLKKLSHSSVNWGDYNNDSYLDVLLSGHTGTSCFAAIYKNIEGTSFEQQTAISLPSQSSGTVAWGDYDNDGDLDILINGECSSDTRIYSNNGDNTFTFESGISLPPVAYGQSAWVDYDNDSDLDLFFAGLSTMGDIANIYRNDCSTPNTPPFPPTNLSSSVKNDSVTFIWNRATDSQTPSAGLSYNVLINKYNPDVYPDEVAISSNSDITSGYRKIVSRGNVGHDTTFNVHGLPAGVYIWSAQAIDNSFEGSVFAPEYYAYYFNIHPTIQAKTINIDSLSLNTASISWENGNGDKRAVFAKQGTAGKASPSDGASFEADSVFGNGDHIGNGWYCVYTGYDNHTTITGLTPDSTYRFMVCEYADVVENYLYNKDTAPGNPTNITIDKKQQTITFGELETKIYGDAPFQLTASASSGLPVSYTSSNTDIATISGNMITIVGAGETVITASQEGNNVYDAANNVEQTLTVNKANQSITFNQLENKTITDDPFQLTATVNSGLSVSYTSSNTDVATISGGTLTITGVGTATITACQEGNSNYEAAIPVEQELTVKPATGLNEISASGVNIYPNPVKEKLTIHLGRAPESIVKYCVIDITGAVIQSGEFSSVSYCIEIKTPHKGVYLLRIDTQKNTIIKHIVKE
jgi:hypothetical protein